MINPKIDDICVVVNNDFEQSIVETYLNKLGYKVQYMSKKEFPQYIFAKTTLVYSNYSIDNLNLIANITIEELKNLVQLREDDFASQNLKIKLNNTIESGQVQEYLFKLGYTWVNGQQIQHTNVRFLFTYAEEKLIMFSDSKEAYQKKDHKEITLPKLKDMAVLYCNNINDATHKTESFGSIYITSENKAYIFRDEKWGKIRNNEFRQAIVPIREPESPPPKVKENLISGADALRALADRKEVEYRNKPITPNWENARMLSAASFLDNPTNEYRLKPRTIKVGDIDVPAPEVIPPQNGTEIFTIALDIENYCVTSYWEGGKTQLLALQRGLIHLNEENAIAYAKALIALNTQS